MKEKVVRLQDPRAVVYGAERLSLLARLRERAEGIGRALGQGWYVHGSIARGDVKRGSDIDLVFLEGALASFEVESRLERAGLHWTSREVVLATPMSSPKGHLHLDEEATVTFPLAGFRPQEEAFYRFGGLLPARGLAGAPRVPGVSKRLLLVMPTPEGHVESSILGREAETASILGVPVDVVNERVRVLGRRDRIGRTGVYLREEVADRSSLEETLRFIQDRDPVVRRAAGGRGKRS
ncbi:MAG: nucleotidyltransferase [Euryarchaeota archaeon]|nr:nucleotidyltransferase [Euryarchaeota archaeon]